MNFVQKEDEREWLALSEVEVFDSMAAHKMKRIRIFLEEIWPSVYRSINTLIDDLMKFLKDTLLSPWQKIR